LDPTQSYYVQNTEPYVRPKGSKSKTLKESGTPSDSPKKTFKKTPTLDKALTDKIMSNMDFDNIMSDPAFSSLIKKK
jgi:hypothetical protein